ncbi:hypothetical protein [Puniceicoccus vermicola]|uniref:PEP-CTERM sorting domain-containing protein n=1 Tax=Puniceicoccus vermicola TaxID=388746 RepID=A0A7X1B1G1_9BACT|nr:hypothetical protein [Puniceicoccus vermicola]MBC2602730.1 hypothetical protein [Puniceicoccus vermicola]
MHNLVKTSLLSSTLLAASGICSQMVAQVYVWENPTRQTDTGTIYTIPKLVEASNASSVSAVRGSDQFGAVQVWGDTGTDWLAGNATINGLQSNDGIMNFSDSSLPDVRFSFSGTPSSSAGTLIASNYAFSSAPGESSSMRVTAGSTTVPVSTTLTIDFGNWNGSIFDSSVNAVRAAGFTLNSTEDRWNDLDSLSVTFYDTEGGALSTQAFPVGFPPADSSSLFFGYESTSATVGSVEITIVGTNSEILGLDEFGFSSIPEASTILYVAPIAIMGVLLHRRRKNSLSR